VAEPYSQRRHQPAQSDSTAALWAAYFDARDAHRLGRGDYAAFLEAHRALGAVVGGLGDPAAVLPEAWRERERVNAREEKRWRRSGSGNQSSGSASMRSHHRPTARRPQ
jgi:hypothetical protein